MAVVASIGAIWSYTSSDFGVSGVLDRFTQIQPKIFFLLKLPGKKTPEKNNNES